jgi:hypothetical protein
VSITRRTARIAAARAPLVVPGRRNRRTMPSRDVTAPLLPGSKSVRVPVSGRPPTPPSIFCKFRPFKPRRALKSAQSAGYWHCPPSGTPILSHASPPLNGAPGPCVPLSATALALCELLAATDPKRYERAALATTVHRRASAATHRGCACRVRARRAAPRPEGGWCGRAEADRAPLIGVDGTDVEADDEGRWPDGAFVGSACGSRSRPLLAWLWSS